MDDITSKFLDKFIELERFITCVILWEKESKTFLLKLGDYYDWIRHEGFIHKLWQIRNWNYPITKIINNSSWFDRLTKYSHIRNKILHEYKWYISVSASAFEELENDLEILKNPKKIWDIRKSIVFTSKKDDNLDYILKKMSTNTYTHIPILDKDWFIEWVISERTILYHLMANINKEGCLMLDNIRIWDIDLTNKNDEYKIISNNTSIYDINDMFLESISLWKKLWAIIITNNWEPDWKIEWIITAWDIPTIKKHFKL